MLTATLAILVAAASRPNFVFMLADDWGWGDVGAYRGGTDKNRFPLTGTGTKTYALDALAANGTLFTDFHVGQSFCAPSRTSFMTGRWPADLHVNTNWNVGNQGAIPNFEAGIPYNLPLPNGTGASSYPGGLPNIAHVMQSSGYATAHFGKWHLGGLNPEWQTTPKPSDYGFDHTATYGSPIQAEPALADSQNMPAGNFTDQWWSADVGDFIRDEGIAFMKARVKEGKPFYLHLWWHMSHDTIDPRPEQLVDFPFKDTCTFPSKQLGQTTCPSQIFWGAQTYSDRERFGPTIAAVDELGIRENTYIIFSTDNGAQSSGFAKGGTGFTNAFDNAVGTQGPFRGAKASLYDGGHRVPFIITGPGVPRGRVDHSLVSSVDWLPTVAAIAGAAIPENTVLRGEDVSDIWHGKANNVITRKKALLWRGGGGPPPCWNRSPALASRNGDWKLLMNPTRDRIELYNMSHLGLRQNGGFFEMQNMASAYPDVVEAMVAPLMAWHHSIGPARPNETDAQLSSGCFGCNLYAFPGLPSD